MATFYRKCMGGFFMGMAAMMLAAFGAMATNAAPPQESSAQAPRTLDYDFFKARVEPIFLKTRGEHARCYACHANNTGPQYLVKLSPGASAWNEEQSRKIFQNVSRLVNKNDPMKSKFLIHPLSPTAGGDADYIHGGGRQFESMDDPDWKNMAAWAKGATLESSATAK